MQRRPPAGPSDAIYQTIAERAFAAAKPGTSNLQRLQTSWRIRKALCSGARTGLRAGAKTNSRVPRRPEPKAGRSPTVIDAAVPAAEHDDLGAIVFRAQLTVPHLRQECCVKSLRGLGFREVTKTPGFSFR